MEDIASEISRTNALAKNIFKIRALAKISAARRYALRVFEGVRRAVPAEMSLLDARTGT